MTNKILFFTTRQLCYHSAGFFAAQLADALEKAGYICEMCEIPEDGRSEERRVGKECRSRWSPYH